MLAFDTERLSDFLRSHLGEPCEGELVAAPVGGQGQSNPTYFVSIGACRFVLRKKPPGTLQPSAHAIDREFRVISALYGSGLPVPRPVLYCDEPDVVGTEFYLMERLNGRIFTDPGLPGMRPLERRAIYFEMARTLATLHALDWKKLGLTHFGKEGNYFLRQLNRLGRQWHELRAESHNPDLDQLLQWLEAHVPGTGSTCIVHGDFKLNNLIYHPSRSEVIGVLDWELSTLGDPLADLAFNCAAWRMGRQEIGGLGDLQLEELGIPSEQGYVADYARCGGRVEGLQPFHIAFAFMRLAVIYEGIASRARLGNAVSVNAAGVGALATVLAARGLKARDGDPQP